MGCGGLYRRLLPDESFRGQPDSRRHSQTGIQNKTDKTRYTRFIHFRSNAFGFGVAAGAKVGLMGVPASERWIGLSKADDMGPSHRVGDNAIHLLSDWRKRQPM